MGPRNLLILFFSTVAVSLVILIIFFSLFFKNVDLNFNTRLPQSAPDIGGMYGNASTMSPDSKADGLMRSTVNVPPEMAEPVAVRRSDKNDNEAAEPADGDLPPMSDDALLDNDLPPAGDRVDGANPDSRDGDRPGSAGEPATEGGRSRADVGKPRGGHQNAASTPIPPTPRAVEHRTDVRPRPIENHGAPDEPPSSAPPVPMQGAVRPDTSAAARPGANDAGAARPSTNYKVVMGRYANREAAEAAASRASDAGASPIVKQVGDRYTVQLGSFSSKENAESLAGKTGARIEPAH